MTTFLFNFTKIILFICIFMINAATQAQTPAGFNLVAYEGFDYTSGTNIANQSGGSGWAGNWEANFYGNSSMFVYSSGLSYSGLSVSGNKLQWGGYGDYEPHSVRRAINNQNSGLVYLQFIADFNSSSGGTDRLDLNSGGTTIASFGGNNAQQKMSILAGSQIMNSTYSVYDLSLVIIQIDYNNNTTKMWVNPTYSTFNYSNPGTADAIYNNSISFDEIALTFRSGGQIDEISIFAAPKLAPTISNFNNISKLYHDGSFSIVAPTSNSAGAFTYTSGNSAVATISGTTVTILGAGTSTITATQAADATYNPASITATLTVSSVALLTNTGAISSTNLNYVNKYGQIGGDFGLSANGAILNAKTPLFKVGDAYQGGIIGYILMPGDAGYDTNLQHGLIAATADIGPVTWKNASSISTTAQGTAIGTGSANTNFIITALGAGTYAASSAKSYSVAGYTSGWYLPSRDEFQKLYDNRVLIGNFNFKLEYWTSTDPINLGRATAWSGNTFDDLDAGRTMQVRPVRSF